MAFFLADRPSQTVLNLAPFGSHLNIQYLVNLPFSASRPFFLDGSDAQPGADTAAMTTSKDRRVFNRRHFDRASGTFLDAHDVVMQAMKNFGFLPLMRRVLAAVANTPVLVFSPDGSVPFGERGNMSPPSFLIMEMPNSAQAPRP